MLFWYQSIVWSVPPLVRVNTPRTYRKPAMISNGWLTSVPVVKGSRYVSQAKLRSKIRGALTTPNGGDAAAASDGSFDFDGHLISANAVALLEAHDLLSRTTSLGKSFSVVR